MAKKKTNADSGRLKKIENRLLQLENVIHGETNEKAVEPWQFLVRRTHPWRKQLYLKGRNLTARQLVGSIQANHLDEANAAENYHLPIEAIREALAYVKNHVQLLEAESEIERLMHQREGGARVPQPVS